MLIFFLEKIISIKNITIIYFIDDGFTLINYLVLVFLIKKKKKVFQKKISFLIYLTKTTMSRQYFMYKMEHVYENVVFFPSKKQHFFAKTWRSLESKMDFSPGSLSRNKNKRVPLFFKYKF
jgi:hypothetical protein